jgi:hypothetical protein
MIQFDFNLNPDPESHRKISFVKSGLRILAGIALIYGSFITTGILLILAEILGIVEEIV